MIAKLVTIIDKGMIYPLLARVDDNFKDMGVEYFEMPDPFAKDNFKILKKNIIDESSYFHREDHLINVSSRFTFSKYLVHNEKYKGDNDSFTFSYAPLMYNFTTKCLELNVEILKELSRLNKDLNILDKDGDPIVENIFYLMIDYNFFNKSFVPEKILFRNIYIPKTIYRLTEILNVPIYVTDDVSGSPISLPDLKMIYKSKIKNIDYFHSSSYPLHAFIDITCNKTGRKLIPYREATYLTSFYDYNKYEEMVMKGLITKEELNNSWIYAK